jgi:hypothetical protein
MRALISSPELRKQLESTDPGSGRFFHRLGRNLVNDLIELEIKIVTQ